MNKFILDWDIFLIKTLKIQAVIQAIICVKLKAAALSCIVSTLMTYEGTCWAVDEKNLVF